MTLLLDQWSAVKSNMALQSTCEGIFQDLYEQARKGLAQGQTSFAEAVDFDGETLPAYFAVLDTPITFQGTAQSF